MRKITRIFVHCTASYQETTTIKSLLNEFKAKALMSPWVAVIPKGHHRAPPS